MYGNPSGVNDSGPFTKVRISAVSSAGKMSKAPSIKEPVKRKILKFFFKKKKNIV